MSATPHNLNPAPLCAASGVPHNVVAGDELPGRLAEQRDGKGIRVLEVITDRSGLRALHARIRERIESFES